MNLPVSFCGQTKNLMRRRKEGSKDLCVWETKLLAHWSGRFSFALKVYPILPTWLCVDMLSVDRQARHILPFGVLKWDKLLLMMDRICIRYCKGLIWNQYCGNSPKTKAPVLDNLVRLLRDWSWAVVGKLTRIKQCCDKYAHLCSPSVLNRFLSIRKRCNDDY